jgi:hypothetical protein
MDILDGVNLWADQLQFLLIGSMILDLPKMIPSRATPQDF